MTKDELDRKISEIERRGDVDAPAQIAYLEKFYETQERETLEAEKRKVEAAEARLRGDLRRAYLAQPGNTDADFERDYPELRAEHMRRRTLAAADTARRSQAGIYREF